MPLILRAPGFRLGGPHLYLNSATPRKPLRAADLNFSQLSSAALSC
jgi:hypothetical protein